LLVISWTVSRFEILFTAGGEAMTNLSGRLIQTIGLAFCLLSAIVLIIGTIKNGPLPVPLDHEGHMAPWPDHPGWGIPDIPDDSPSSRDARSR
jgi:hypothetical protein